MRATIGFVARHIDWFMAPLALAMVLSLVLINTNAKLAINHEGRIAMIESTRFRWTDALKMHEDCRFQMERVILILEKHLAHDDPQAAEQLRALMEGPGK